MKYTAKELAAMSVEMLVNALSIGLVGENKLCVNNARGLTDKEKAVLVNRKPETVKYLIEKKAAEEERRAERTRRIESIEGLEEIRAALYELEKFHEEFENAMEEGNGFLPARPAVNVDALRALFPRANAYLEAEAWSMAAHYMKSACGREALEKIIYDDSANGHIEIIAEMKKKWSDYGKEHAWD